MASVLFLAVFDQPIMDSSVIGCWSVAEKTDTLFNCPPPNLFSTPASRTAQRRDDAFDTARSPEKDLRRVDCVPVNSGFLCQHLGCVTKYPKTFAISLSFQHD